MRRSPRRIELHEITRPAPQEARAAHGIVNGDVPFAEGGVPERRHLAPAAVRVEYGQYNTMVERIEAGFDERGFGLTQ